MPAPIDDIIKRRVVQQWLAGEARDRIAIDNNIGSGTVSSIVNSYKIGLDNLDLDSFRGLMVEAKKEGLIPSDLASHVRLNNYLVKSGAAEDKIESFIANVSTNDVSPEKVIQYMNQLYDVSKEESIPLEQVSSYIKEKLEEKKKIEEEIKQTDAILQSKNVSIHPFVSATMHLIADIKKYNKINGLKKELSTLYLFKFAINEACSSQTESHYFSQAKKLWSDRR
jgi:hypothetical protein